MALFKTTIRQDAEKNAVLMALSFLETLASRTACDGKTYEMHRCCQIDRFVGYVRSTVGGCLSAESIRRAIEELEADGYLQVVRSSERSVWYAKVEGADLEDTYIKVLDTEKMQRYLEATLNEHRQLFDCIDYVPNDILEDC